jgi:hypothetical protein
MLARWFYTFFIFPLEETDNDIKNYISENLLYSFRNVYGVLVNSTAARDWNVFSQSGEYAVFLFIAAVIRWHCTSLNVTRIIMHTRMEQPARCELLFCPATCHCLFACISKTLRTKYIKGSVMYLFIIGLPTERDFRREHLYTAILLHRSYQPLFALLNWA